MKRRIWFVAAFVLTTGCKADAPKSSAPQPFAEAAQPAQPPTPPAPPSDASPGEGLKLPAARLDATRIIGQGRAGVTHVLGEPNANDVYERGPDHGVMVLYDKGKASGIEVLGTETRWNDFSDEQRTFIREWFGVPPNNIVADTQVTIGESLDGYSLGLYVKSSIPALRKIVAQREAEQQKAIDDDMQRAEAEGLVARHVTRSIGHAEGDVLQVRSAEEHCNQQTLASLKRQLGRERLRHFRQLVCWTAGKTRASLDAQ